MPRRCTTGSCAQTVPNAQEIQIGMLHYSAVRERSGGYARREGQARRFRRAGCSNVAFWSRKWRIAPHFQTSTRRMELAGARREIWAQVAVGRQLHRGLSQDGHLSSGWSSFLASASLQKRESMCVRAFWEVSFLATGARLRPASS